MSDLKPLDTVEATELSHYASYFINGDASGLDGDEAKLAQEIEEGYAEEDLFFVDCGEESFFGMPDHGDLRGDCLTYTLMYNPERRSKSVHKEQGATA